MFATAYGNPKHTASLRNYLQENGTIYKWYNKISHKSLCSEWIGCRFDNNARVSRLRLRAESPNRAV